MRRQEGVRQERRVLRHGRRSAAFGARGGHLTFAGDDAAGAPARPSAKGKDGGKIKRRGTGSDRAAGNIQKNGHPINSCTQYLVPPSETSPTAMPVKLSDRMFARWPGEFIQPFMTASALLYPAAMFSPSAE